MCAEGWVPNNLTAAASGLCYKHVPSPMNWTAARRECEEAAPHHGDLASVPDEATNLFLMSLTEAEAWTGGFRENNLWQWSDGSAWRYQAWHPRQPDNPNQDQQRLTAKYEGENTVFVAPIFFFDFLIFLGLLAIEMRDIGIGSV